MKVGRYNTIDLIAETEHSRIYLASLDESYRQFALKLANPRTYSDEWNTSVKNEYGILQSFYQDTLELDLFKHQDQWVLARKYFNGTTLAEWSRGGKIDLREKVEVLISLAKEIGTMHSKQVIHKDLSPANILIDKESNEIKLIDFESSSKVDFKSVYLGNPQKIEGTLKYIAPEQTGRMNRVVDYRSDLYSLGVIMYEIFAGVVPFDRDDALELLHDHLSQKPQSIRTLIPEFPLMLDNIVLKLLEKSADDRYQSAFSIVLDLERCHNKLIQGGGIENFEIGQFDVPQQFKIPGKIYGREEELKHLLDAFQLCLSGRKLLVTVGGYSGIGKSSLVYELHKPITLKKGLFIDGKFDQMRKATPYSAWIQAIDKLVDILLTENADVLDTWKKRIIQYLGESIGVITELVPSLEKIIGKQEIVKNLTATEDLNRFNYALRQFIKCLSTRESPLVIFLDDMQWADGASLNLMNVIMTEPGLGYLLLINAYRDNEVGDSHPYIMSMDNLDREWKKINETDTSLAFADDNRLIINLKLNNLKNRDIENLAFDTFKNKSDKTIELASIIFQKTKGNPFFTHKLLESLYDENLVSLKNSDNVLYWDYDLNTINQRYVSDNVMDILELQLEKLPSEIIEILRVAACFGSRFELNELGVISGYSLEDLEEKLQSVIFMGFIIPIQSDYKFINSREDNENLKFWFKFAHDRVRQILHESQGNTDIANTHLQIGTYLLGKINIEDSGDRIFELAEHFNYGQDNEVFKEVIQRVNFVAGRKAKASTAYEIAYKYFLNVIENNTAHDWDKDYEKLIELYINTAECAYLTGEYEATNQWTEQIIKYSKFDAHYAKAIEIRIEAYFLQQKFNEAVSLGIDALQKLGIKFPKNPGKFHIVKELLSTKWAIRKFEPEYLITIKDLDDPKLNIALKLMATVSPSVFFINVDLFIIFILRITKLTFLNGISSYSLQSLANYAFILSVFNKEVEKGLAINTQVLQLVNRKSLSRYKIRTKFVAYFFVEHLRMPVYNTLGALKQIFQEGLESGDSDFTSFVGNAYVTNGFQVGYDLEELIVELRRLLQYSIQVKNYTSKTFNEVYFQYTACLRGEAEENHILNGVYFRPSESLPELTKSNNLSTIFNYNLFQTQLYTLYGRYEEARSMSTQMEKRIQAVIGTPQYTNAYFSFCIHEFQMIFVNGKTIDVNKSRIKKFHKKIKDVALWCKEDFVHKDNFISGILMALEGKHTDAIKWFDKSISEVDELLNRFDKALMLLVYARYVKNIGLSSLADLKFSQSAALFFDWGASAVGKYIMTESDQTISVRKNFNDNIYNLDSSSSGKNGVDIFSLIKATQVISGEIELNALLKKLLSLMIENAGAERGILILEEQGDYKIKLELDNLNNEIPTQNQNYSDYTQASTQVMNYVLRSGNPIILDEAYISGRFVNDSYITKNKVKSLLCMNVVHKNNLIGLVYLENNLVSAAFTQQRIEILKILGAQASFSIENVRYFQHINQLNLAYERFVPQEFLEQLGKKSIIEIGMGNQVAKNMAVLFADIRGFTSISEKLSAAQVFELLNEVWGILNPVLDYHGAIIDKYIGDSIMALFPKNPENALRAAVDMQYRLIELNATRSRKSLFPIEMGIGLNSGSMILGTVGSESRLNTTVIGDSVNTAARLESLSKQLGVKILVTAEYLSNIHDLSYFNLRSLGRVPLKGKKADTEIFEEFSAHDNSLKKQIIENIALFKRMVAQIEKGEKQEGELSLKLYKEKVPYDPVLEYYTGLLN